MQIILRAHSSGIMAMEVLLWNHCRELLNFLLINGMVIEDFDGDGNLDICMNRK